MKIYGISRKKLNTDGPGITNLVALANCPLCCKYCLNKNIIKNNTIYEVSNEELLNDVMQEYCYFVATNGGITLGGAEPLLQWKEILDFYNILEPKVSLNIETSLQGKGEAIEALKPIINFWLIDIKTLDNNLYKKYTGGDNKIVLENLNRLLEVQDKCKIRIPIIPNYKDKEIALKEYEQIKEMGFNNIEIFNYIIR